MRENAYIMRISVQMNKISDILGDWFWYDMNFKEAVITTIIYLSVAYIRGLLKKYPTFGQEKYI